MTAATVNIIALIFIAAMLAAVMLIAWHSFGRPRHALLWAVAYAVGAGGWVGNLLLRLYPSDSPMIYAGISGLICLFYGLLAMGFIQRRQARARIMPLLIGAIGAALVIALVVFVLPHRGARAAIWLVYGGGMMLVSAASVARPLRRSTIPERAVALMLIMFAIIDFGIAALALAQNMAAQGEGLNLLRIVLMLLQPPAFIGVGLFSVFLVAADLAENMRMLATSDELTGIYNRRGFEDAAERAIRNAQRQRQPLAVVIADIDNFKAINDRHGHSAGDRALRHFASRLDRLVRRGDLIGRIGGEEFALLLVNTRAEDALDVVERIRRDIAAMPVEGASKVAMTASFGVTCLKPGDIALAALLSRADRALYRSKLEGRDRVTSAEDLEDAI